MRQDKSVLPAEAQDAFFAEGGKADQSLASQLIDALDHGLVYWSKTGRCMMRNSQSDVLLELPPGTLPEDPSLETTLTFCATRGDFGDVALESLITRFAGQIAFRYDHHLPSGKILCASARPTRGGGFIVSYTEVTEHRQAVAALHQARTEAEIAQRKTDHILEDERTRQREGRHLASLDEWLQSCQTLQELYRVVSEFMAFALPATRGQLFIFAPERDLLELVCNWNFAECTINHLAPNCCWALRRGRRYLYSPDTLSFPCGHVSDATGEAELPDQTLCVPIVAHGDTVGLLHMQLAEGAENPDVLDPLAFASRCGERISMAIANVKLRDELQDRSDRDPLTNLLNRRVYLDTIRRGLLDSAALQTGYAVMSVDADHFKRFNDNHGHDAGDEVLKALAEEMRKIEYPGAMGFRLGGEEFSVLLPKADRTRASQAAEAFRQAVETMVVSNGGERLPSVTVSIGIAIFPTHGTEAADLVKQSDVALYAAKGAGRNNWQIAEGDGMIVFE